jgi:DNA-binding transcriptional ArsR family regulator
MPSDYRFEGGSVAIKWDENGKREIEQNPSLTGNDAIMMKALAHPVRARALTVLNERMASPSELAEEQNEAVGYVAYHVRVLREMELIELVKSRQVRGATEHFYRGTIKPYLSDDFWERLPKDARNGVSVAGLEVLNQAVKQAFEAGTFDARIDRHLSNLCVELDEEGWRQANELLANCLKGLIQIGAEAESRSNGSKPMRATFGLMGFESPAK